VSLATLAEAHGIETTWVDVRGREHEVDEDVVRALLDHLGGDAGGGLEPVTVAWDGRAELAVPASVTEVVLTFEDGAEQAHAVEDGGRVSLAHLPVGVHQVHAGDEVGTVIAAPSAMPTRAGRSRQWGVFAPLHAVRDGRDAPIGDLTALRALGTWATDRGADWVATLPLLPAAYDEDPVDPSPYRPLTRLAWNELYLDPARLPELDAEEVLPPPLDGDSVDWATVAKEVEALLTRAVDRLSDRRRAELEIFLAARPELAGYARFRGRHAPALELVHAYAQWALHDQLEEVAESVVLYLDLPLGVHPDGYDATVHASTFATGVTVGAPPDDLAPDGQDWGFAPPHPERARAGGHPYLRACLDHHLGPARMLRLDHVMGLHRLWWIPPGASPEDGAYVRYPAEEQYAVLALAAARHGAEIVGENLGTVPPEVDEALTAHGLVGMWPYQLADGEPPAGSLAVLNTHDMPPYAAWRAEHPDAPLIEAVLADLGAGPARHVQVSLEDLWGETRPQNVPGTGPEAANWRRRAARTLPEVAADPEVEATLDGLEAARRTAQTRTERSAS
jgi:4-alpha-glucanotransferase